MSAPARADVVWPALYVAGGLATWWVIAVGLLVEFPIVWWLVKGSWSRAALLTLIANLVSTLLGLLAVPLLGVVWELTLGQVAMRILDAGTFNPAAWVGAFLLAAAFNALAEAVVLRRASKLTSWAKPWAAMAAANAVSVALAFWAIREEL